MAPRDTVRRHHPSTTLPYFAAVLFLSLLLLILSLLRSPSSPAAHRTASPIHTQRCNYSSRGAWIKSPDPVTPRYDHRCKEIYKGWSCVDKSNSGELHRWMWSPSDCSHPLPQFDPRRFLTRFRNTNIGKCDLFSSFL